MIQTEQVATELRKFVGSGTRNPGASYSAGECVYTDEHGLHCIAGEVLSIIAPEHCPPYGHHLNAGIGMATLAHEEDMEISEDALNLLAWAQEMADSNETWGDAAAHALKTWEGDQ